MSKPIPLIPEPGQESVWDYPRPPRLEPSDRHVLVCYGEKRIAESRNTIRVLETSHPPVYYIPQRHVDLTALQLTQGTTHCEWKGQAQYYDLVLDGERVPKAAWSYPHPVPGYQQIAGYLAFYPSKLSCYLDQEPVTPQPGGFYGGWVTREIVGPFKGEPGTQGW